MQNRASLSWSAYILTRPIGPGRLPVTKRSPSAWHNPGAKESSTLMARPPPPPASPADGMNLLPVLSQNAAPVPRKLFWRYKANAERAVRDGDYKFLKILDNTFLFNVVDDPLERANLKERQKDIYQKLVREWYDWNSSMLPEIKESFTHSFSGEELADHFGAKSPDQMPDIPRPPDD